MRIVGGIFRGKQLTSPKSDDIRPTTDRVRENLFNILASRIGPNFSGRRVLDLFAGTGALGLEAMSRGADFASFVDIGAEARGLIREHIESMGLGGKTKVLRRDAAELGRTMNFEPFNLIFMDPPYSKGLGEQSLRSASQGGWIAPDALIVLEEKKGVSLDLPQGIEADDSRDYGDTTVWFLTPKT